MTKFRICAGHSYSTPGKQVPTMKEYEFNRVVAEYVRQELANYDNVEVSFTHEDGRDVPLQERTDKANAWGADAYISIHANAGPASATGLESFIHPRADQSTRSLGLSIHNHLILLTGMRNRGLKEADFHVLRETRMKAVLVECGFMTNAEDLIQLKNDKYRRNCAVAITRGLVEHFKLVKKVQPTEPVKPSENGLYRVQVGAFSEKANADRFAAELKSKGYSVTITQ